MTDPDNLDFTVPDPWGDLAGYALNALSPEERERVDALLESSPEARDELRRFTEAAENLAHLAPDVEPSYRVKRLLMAQVDSDLHLRGVAQEDARAVNPPSTPLLRRLLRPVHVAYTGAAAAIVALVAVTAVSITENSRLDSDLASLRQDIEQSRGELAALQTSIDEAQAHFVVQDAEVARLRTINAGLEEALKNQQWLTFVTQNREYRVPEYLEGSAEAPEAIGTLAVKNFDDEAVFLVSSLAPAPQGYQYMLSLVQDGVPTPVAAFQVNEAGQGRVEFVLPGSISEYDSAVVTLEAFGTIDDLSGQPVMVASDPQ